MLRPDNLWGKIKNFDQMNGFNFPWHLINPAGRIWHVDSADGNDDNPGLFAGLGEELANGNALLTVAAGLAKMSHYDNLVLSGYFREQVDTPASIYDCTIIGGGNLPRQATEGGVHTGGGAYWDTPASPTAATPLLRVLHQSWKIANIAFQSPTDAPSIRFFRNAADTQDGSHSTVVGCYFAGRKYGVESHGGVARIRLYGNEFLLFDASGDVAVKETTGAGTGTCWGWEIIGNTFHANHTDISGALVGAKILDNDFKLDSLTVTNTVAIDTTGGNRNAISDNRMYSASNASGINARFVVGSADLYMGNEYSDVREYAEPAE